MENTLTNQSRATDLSGLAGHYDYTPTVDGNELGFRLRAELYRLYGLDVPTYHLMDIIHTIGVDERQGGKSYAKRFLGEWRRRNGLPEDADGYYSYRPVTEVGAVVGDVYKQLVSHRPTRLYYRVTTDIEGILGDTGESGGYGNPDSCWYGGGSYSGAPYALEQSGGAVLLVGTATPVTLDNGIGRVFLVPAQLGLAIFNPYLSLDGVNRNQSDLFSIFGALVAHALGYTDAGGGHYVKPPYRDVHWVQGVFGDIPETMYINNNAGYMLIPWECGSCDYIDAQLYNPRVCDHCGYGLEDGEPYHDPDGNLMCEDCYSRYCTVCQNCGDVIWIDDAIYDPDYGDYCQRCYDRSHDTCERCGAVINTDYDELHYTSRMYVCSHCRELQEREQEQEQD